MFESLISYLASFFASFFSPDSVWPGMDRNMRKLESLMQKFSSPDSQSPAKLRRLYRFCSTLWTLPQEPSVVVREETVNENISLRWYLSEGSNERCLVYFHGGGMMLGDLQTHDRFCQRIAHKRKMMVVSVTYRLAPEHPFPAGAEDAITAWNFVARRWQEQKKELKSLGIGGDSAGGYLATMVCQQYARPSLSVKPVLMPAWQWLIYPVTDCLDRHSESWVTYSHGLVVSSQLLSRFYDAYIPEREQQALPEVSPVQATADVLAMLPPAVVITAEYDPLRDQGMAYARLLRAAGVAVVSHHEAKLPHGYISFGGFSDTALRGIDKAVSLIDMVCLQARRTMPGRVKATDEVEQASIP